MLNRRDQITYIRGKSNFLVYMTSNGKVVFYDYSDSLKIIELTKSNESALKFMIEDDKIYLIVCKVSRQELRFYRVDIKSLRKESLNRCQFLKSTKIRSD